jgi:hypothetical protein
MRGSPVFVPILRCLPSRVAFLGAMSDFLLSRALLPLIPPTPFSHKGRRGLLGVLMAETKDGTQGLKKPTPVRDTARAPTTGHNLERGRPACVEQPDYAGTAYEDIPGASRLRGAAGGTLPLSRVDFLGAMRDFLLSRALLPLIPPTPFSHKGRRGLLGVLMAETKDGTQGLKNPPL